jgi:hypothetical protein
MSGPKRNPDKLNTIGVVVVGICGAVLVYVSINALQAFYMNDTAPIQEKADYGDMEVTAKGKKADELRNITEPAANPAGGTYHIRIEDAMKLVVADAKTDPTHLTGKALPPSVVGTIPAAYGRPKIGGEGAGSAAPPAGAGSAAPAGAGSAAPGATMGSGSAAGSAATMTPTGAAPGGGGAGASPAPAAVSPQPATTPTAPAHP